MFALGSYCLDSKNSFCFFPGTPYFHRVLECSLLNSGDEDTADGSPNKKHRSKKEDLKVVRDWAMSHNPPENMSSHWWYHELDSKAKEAFDNCASSSQIQAMFRSLFGENHYCMDIVSGMNEVYVTGPSRAQQNANSDHVFYSRHVDGPYGLVPFVSVYRCIVGMDNNNMVS